MAMIWRRTPPTTPGDEPQVVSAVSGLTAASARIPAQRWGKATKPSGERGNWSREAWDMLGLVGELSFALLWKTALLSRFRLVASDIDPDTGKPTGQTGNEQARAIVAGIAGGVAGQSQMLGRLAPLLMIPGEGWLAIIYPDGIEQWHILSSSEIKSRGDDVDLTLQDGTTYRMQPDTDTLTRIWRPDPEKSYLAWSPTKAALPILREIVRMSQDIEASGKSRLAGNGLLVVPNEISMPATPPPTGAPSPDAPNLPPPPPAPSRFVTADDLRKALQEAMATAIADPSSAAALVPIILQVAGEHVDKIRHIKFDSEVSEKAQATREKAVRRLAMTLDMPPEVLLGLADLNHWSLWGVEEEAVRWHAAPDMETICAALTRELLWPLLPEGTNVVVWYDTSDTEAAPDRPEKVRDAYDRGAANAQSYRRALGMGDDEGYDFTTRDGWVMWATDQISKNAAMLPTLAPLLQALMPDVLANVQIGQAAEPPPPAIEAPADDDERGTPDTMRENAARAVIQMCVRDALRRAGKRRHTRANHAALRGIPDAETHLHLEPCTGQEVGRLIEGWEELADLEVCAAAGVEREQLRQAVVTVCRAALLTGTRPVVSAELVRGVLA